MTLSERILVAAAVLVIAVRIAAALWTLRETLRSHDRD